MTIRWGAMNPFVTLTYCTHQPADTAPRSRACPICGAIIEPATPAATTREASMICRCVFDTTVKPPTVDATHCDHPNHRHDAAAHWNGRPHWRHRNLVNAPKGAAP